MGPLCLSVLSTLIQLKPLHAAAGFKVESEHEELHVILYIQPPSLKMGYYLCQKLLLNLIKTMKQLPRAWLWGEMFEVDLPAGAWQQFPLPLPRQLVLGDALSLSHPLLTQKAE